MPLILNIETAVENASVCLAKNGEVVNIITNSNQKDHAAWLHPAIRSLIVEAGYDMINLDAVAVSAGPGSYTGLRVGWSTAKGLCYALKIPLITINTLKVMAFAAKEHSIELISPMIDARRMEVFTGVFDKNLEEIVAGHACILDKDLYSDLLKKHRVIFFGNGSEKFRPLVQAPNAGFPHIESNASHLAALSHIYFEKSDFTDLAYSEPLYLKEFYTPVKKSVY